jgi:hypothetical protein
MPHVHMTYAVPTPRVTASDFVRGQFTVTGQVLRLVGGCCATDAGFLSVDDQGSMCFWQKYCKRCWGFG